jgi:multisubunit Na+/H+ antiporter MnhB subunit
MTQGPQSRDFSAPTPAGQQGFGMQPQPQSLRPHRGSAVLVLGILGLIVCPILGIVAWVMGNNDLRQMAAGQMDVSGRGLTSAGRICGMISVILVCLNAVIAIVVVLVMLAAR